MVFIVVVTGIALYAVPWVQTATGLGRITALNPSDRLQIVTALVEGRIKRWYVQEGSRLKAGDPIVEIEDLDPLFVDRLAAERQAVFERYRAAQNARQTALIDYQRQERLFKDGLSARSTFEAAKIRYEEHQAREAAAKADLNKAEINLSQQATRMVRAPRDGTVLGILAGDVATFVKPGQSLAAFLPLDAQRAVEIFVRGVDAPLVYKGRKVRLMFDGWPAIQWSGWPARAIGTFGGIVDSVDPNAQPNGLFRVLITEDPLDPWPHPTYVRFGSQAQGWVLLNTVRLGYEIWRQMNGFPPLTDAQAEWGGYRYTRLPGDTGS
jgi:multidrug resistance efflux pump